MIKYVRRLCGICLIYITAKIHWRDGAFFNIDCTGIVNSYQEPSLCVVNLLANTFDNFCAHVV